MASSLPERHSPPVVGGSVGELLPLPHAQAGHGPGGTLVVHVLHAARGHWALRHEGLAASRHWDVVKNRRQSAFPKPKALSSHLLLLIRQIYLILI